MAEKKRGAQSVLLQNRPRVLSFASMAGPKEAEGPLAGTFDETFTDDTLGEKSWERAESQMQERVVRRVLEKAQLPPSQVQGAFAGDLLNQCVGSTYGLRGLGVPYVGLFGACSTMAEALVAAAETVSAFLVRPDKECAREKRGGSVDSSPSRDGSEDGRASSASL